jgi:hypothetical protein
LLALKRHNVPAARNAAVLIREREDGVSVLESGDVDRYHWPLLGALVGLFVVRLPRSDREHATEGWITALRASFPPGGSALVMLFDGEQAEGTLALLDAFQGQIWDPSLTDDLMAQLASAMAPGGR